MREWEEMAHRMIAPLLIAFTSVVVRLMFDETRPTLSKVIRLLCIGLFVGGLVGAVIDPMDIPAGYKGGIVGVVSLVADDVVAVIVHAGGHIRRDPISAIKALFALKWRK